jgi:hypothetical protein
MNAGKALLVTAALLGAISIAVFGRPAPVITVMWSGVPAGARPYLENKFSLTDGHEVADGIWSYALRDTSETNRRTLATHAAVAAVEGIDRRTFEFADHLPRATWRSGLVPVPHLLARTIEVVGLLAALAGLTILWRPRAAAAAIARCRALPRVAAAWLQRGIPEAAPEAAAAFRLVFGSLVVAFFVSDRVYPALLTPLEVSRASGAYGAVVRWLAAHPEVVKLIQPVLIVTGGLFVIGAATRISFLAFTAAALAWTIVFTLNTSSHAVASLMMALLMLLPARWGDAWSVDAWLRRRRDGGRAGPARAHGYAFWAPGFVLAVAFAAAAWSKIREGPEWILNGTVKYHFVSDLEHAWVSWGPVLTRRHGVAVALCIFAVVAEASLITSMFSGSFRYRAVLGFFAVLLLAGFALFQGIVWLGWWLLLSAFLPWHLIGQRRSDVVARASPRPITAAQLAAICFVVLQQLVTTARHVEARPLFSTYDMYSTTYASVEDYEAASNLVYRVVAVANGRSSDLPGCVVDDTVAAIARRALEGSADDLRLLRTAVGGCLRSTPGVRQVALEGDRQVFLWNESRFAWKRRLDVIGPIEADRLRE